MFILPFKKKSNIFAPFFQTPGLQFYVDSRDPANTLVQPANSSAIASWNDKSGFGRNFANGTGIRQPTYTYSSFGSLPGLVYNGSNSLLGSVSIPTGSFTIYFVLNLSSTGTTFLMDSQGTAARFLLSISSGNWAYTDGTGTGFGIAAASTGAQVISYVLNATANTGTIYRNGSSLGASTFTANGFGGTTGLGSDFTSGFGFMSGTLGLAACYNWAHDATTRLNLERKMAYAYGIACA